MRGLRSRDDAIDAALAAAAGVLNIAAVLAPDPSTSYDFRDSHGLGLALAAAGGLGLLWRRRRPLASFVAIMSTAGLVASLSWDPGYLPFTVAAASYGLGAYGSRASVRVGMGVVAAWLALLFSISAPSFGSLFSVVEFAGIVVGLTLLGWAVAHRRRRADQARERAVAIAGNSARETERTVLAERLRVARELNDVVTDTLMAITLKAATVSGAADDAGRSLQILKSVESASRAATADLRRMLRALRDPNDVLTPLSDDDADHDEPGLHAALLRETGWTTPPSPGPNSRDIHEPGQMPQWPVDVALGTGVMVLNVAGSIVADTSTSVAYAEPVLPVLIILAAIPGLALMFRRRFAILALVAAVVALVAVDAAGWQTGTLPGSIVLATYALGAWVPPGRGAIVLIATDVALPVAFALGLPHHDDGAAWEALVVFNVPWAIGARIRHRREDDRRQVERLMTVEREQAVATERALAEERLRIARELHDLVSHNLAAITVQAAAAGRDGSGLAATEAFM